MSNVYYSPEKFGLKIVEEHDYAGAYEFDMIVLWEDLETGEQYFGADSGCSCPLPFGDMGKDGLTRLRGNEAEYKQLYDNANRY